MNKRAQDIVKEVTAIIDDRLVGNKAIPPADCVEALEEIWGCAESWAQTIKEEHDL